MRRLLVLVSVLATACGAGAAPQVAEPKTPGPTAPVGEVVAPAAPPAADPFAVEGLPREEWLPLLKGPANATSLAPPGTAFADVSLPPLPKGVPAAPATCNAWVKRATAAKGACGTRDEALARLDAAMQLADGEKRDGALAELESCAGLEPGFARSLRIELGPAECGDALAAPLLAKKPEGLSGSIHHVLVGQALAARLTRAVASPPVLDAPFTKDRVQKFVSGPMLGWFKDQSIAVESLSKAGANLAYYGRGLVALAAGTADLRLVDAVRSAPVPDEFRKDPELANAYYAALDEQLEPRKTRGRDGALVGLGELSHAGVLDDARATAARNLLTKLYGGRRVDALDALVVPALPSSKEATPTARLAARLPTFHAGLVLAPEAAGDPEVLAAFARKGLPVAQRAWLKDAQVSDAVRALHARIRLELGRRTWRAVDLDLAARQYAAIPRASLQKDDRMLFALALALRGGPDDLAVLMRQSDAFSARFGDVAALDLVAKEHADHPSAGLAAFDAALVRQLAMPRGSAAAAWRALADRYRAASALLTSLPQRNEAEERARAADATAAALDKAP